MHRRATRRHGGGEPGTGGHGRPLSQPRDHPGGRAVMPAVDPITFQVLKASLGGIVQEMQNSLFRTGYSTIIRESQDASCALMAPDGKVVAQHVVLPLHIGAFGACCESVLRVFGDRIAPGDAFLINHPYEGGSPHAPDFAVITPFFGDDRLLAFCGSMAHKSDIGGPVPGSCSATAREIYNEGLHLPAVRLEAAGEPQTDVTRIVAANSRTPDVVLGDIRGQLGSARLGERRLAELVDRQGPGALPAYIEQLLRVTEERVRREVHEWPDGEAAAERFVDDDGVDLGKPLRVHARVRKQGDQITFDFMGTTDQARGPANIRPPLLQAACAYVLIALIDPGMDINAGLFSAFALRARPGSLVDPHFPAAVNTYNPTVHAVIDALFDAMSRIVPGRGRADGSASRSFIVGGAGRRPGTRYVQYELFGGGSGATASHDGVSATTVNQTNGRIASIEIVESEFPTRVRRFEPVPDSGGPGRQRGGLAFLREYENLQPAQFALRSTRHDMPPRGAGSGRPGGTGRLLVDPDAAEPRELPARTARHELSPGDVFQLRTPGGGGYGDPLERDPEAVRRDVEEGYVTADRAADDYGVALVMADGSWYVECEATARLRARVRDQR
ncbi:MAG: hypothetical protein GEU81_09290 [Nitriliruptorales bacterium]|nr:hypothetical protein [Nitriliruptorales bacterium]